MGLTRCSAAVGRRLLLRQGSNEVRHQVGLCAQTDCICRHAQGKVNNYETSCSITIHVIDGWVPPAVTQAVGRRDGRQATLVRWPPSLTPQRSPALVQCPYPMTPLWSHVESSSGRTWECMVERDVADVKIGDMVERPSHEKASGGPKTKNRTVDRKFAGIRSGQRSPWMGDPPMVERGGRRARLHNRRGSDRPRLGVRKRFDQTGLGAQKVVLPHSDWRAITASADLAGSSVYISAKVSCAGVVYVRMTRHLATLRELQLLPSFTRACSSCTTVTCRAPGRDHSASTPFQANTLQSCTGRTRECTVARQKLS